MKKELTQEELKEETIKLILKNNTGNFLSSRRKDELIRWIKTGDKPIQSNSKDYRTFYEGYAKLRKAELISNNLRKLGLIKDKK